MLFLRTILATALISVCMAVTASADEPAADPMPCGNSTYTNHGVSNNRLVFNNGGYRAFVDRRVQRASHPSCDDYVRAAVNFRCQRSNQQGVWAPVNCGAGGLILLYEDGREKGGGYDFGSTGPDGTISIYTKWVKLGTCKPYWTDLSIHQITMNYQVQYRGGFVGPSATYPGCASKPPAGQRAAASAAAEPCAGSTVKNEAVRNGFLVFSNGSYRAHVDHRLQVAQHPTCPDLIRTAANFRCQRSTQQGGWTPVNCGSAGTITLQKSGAAAVPKGYGFGSTGTDGTISVYGHWVGYSSCSLYWGELDIAQVTINNQIQFRSGDGGTSDTHREC